MNTSSRSLVGGLKLSLALGLTALGVNALADSLPYGTLPTWQVTWTNSAGTLGHLTTDAAHGGWTLLVQRDTTRWGGFSLTIGYRAQYGQGSGVVSGAGILDLRGAISGTDPKSSPATNAVWRIGSIESWAFVANDGGNPKADLPASEITGVHTPGTLYSDGMKDFFHHDRGDPRPKVTYVHIIEPYITAVPGWFFNGCNSMTNLVFVCPNATSIGEHIMNCRTPNLMDFNACDFTKVKTVGLEAMSNWTKASGALRLPNAETLSFGAFRNCAISNVILGVNGNLKSIGSYAFAGSALKHVVLGSAASGSTYTICTNAFYTTSIEHVWMNSEVPPTYQKDANAYSFGTANTTEGSITFHVRDTPAFAEILAAADADPNRLVDKSYFNTAQKVRVERFGGLVKVDTVSLYDPRFQEKYDERITITYERPVADDSLWFCPITLTASCSDAADASGRKAAFHRWHGVSAEREQENPLVIEQASDFPSGVCAVFNHDWFYDTAANVISNGIWSINVYPVDASKHTLKIGQQKANEVLSTAYTGTGSGILDLNGTVRDADGQAWTLAATTGYCFTKMRSWDNSVDSTSTMAKVLPTAIVFPETLTTMAGSEFNFNQSREWPLKEIVCILPQYSGRVYFEMNGPMLLQKLFFRAPGATSISKNCFWQNCNLSESSFDDWDLSGVTAVNDEAFGVQGCSGTKGTLRLPALKTMGHNNFRGSALEGVVLATNLTLTSIGTNCFSNCASLKTIVIGNAKAGLSIGTASFSGKTSPTSVTFLGRLNAAAADQVLSGVTATAGAKTCTLYASPRLGWSAAQAAMTESEAQVAPSGAAGVYREGSRKAWMMPYVSPFDPMGLIFILK